MKAILMSLKSKRIAKIHNGEKNIEIRIRFPSDYVGWIYIYCTENSKLLHKNVADIWWVEDKGFQKENKRLGIEQQLAYNGKVVSRFWCNNVEEIKMNLGCNFFTKTLNEEELKKQACLNTTQIEEYLLGKRENFKCAYAIPVTKLEIFDKPKELSEFENYNMVREVELNAEYYKGFDTSKITVVKKAPQSWFYVEAKE